MRLNILVFLLVAVVGSVILGWIFEDSRSTESTAPELEIPRDIDYFLSSLKFRVFDQQGKLDYDMQSTHLEHFTHRDVSQMQSPSLNIYGISENWQVESKTAEALHRFNWLVLNDNVVVQKNGENPLKISSQSMLFKPDENLMLSDENIRMESTSATIDAETAVFDLEENVYNLQKIRAIYYNEKG